jgi:predicted nucleic acid-binding protein
LSTGVLDLLVDRAPYADSAAMLFAAVEQGEIVGCLCGTTVTTIHYLVAKARGRTCARDAVSKLLALFEIAPITRPVLEEALVQDFDDFEDAVITQAARHVGAQAIVTRNGRDFLCNDLSICTPDELINTLQATREL